MVIVFRNTHDYYPKIIKYTVHTYYSDSTKSVKSLNSISYLKNSTNRINILLLRHLIN